MYQRCQSSFDKEFGVVRVKGVVFPSYVSDEEIRVVFKDLSKRSIVPSGVMTSEALFKFLNLPKDDKIRSRIQNMPVGGENVFSYDSGKAYIMRYTRLTYIGRYVK